MMTVGIPKVLTEEEVIRILQNIDWNEFWKKVTENSAKEIEAYHIASAKSKGIIHVFV